VAKLTDLTLGSIEVLPQVYMGEGGVDSVHQVSAVAHTRYPHINLPYILL